MAPLDETLNVAPGKLKWAEVCDVGEVDSLPAVSAKSLTLPPMPVTYTWPLQVAGDEKMPPSTAEVLGNAETDWTIWLSLPLWKWPMLSRLMRYSTPGLPDARSSCGTGARLIRQDDRIGRSEVEIGAVQRGLVVRGEVVDDLARRV